MRKNIFKKVFILSLVLLMVLQQGNFFMGTAASDVDNTSKLSIAIDGNPTSETTIINIKQVVKEIEGEDVVQKVELYVPQGATFDSEKTKSLGQGQADVTYKADDRKVIIEWNTVSPEQQAKVVFKDLEQPNYLFTAEGIHGEIKVKSNELAIQMPAPVVEEKPAEQTEEKKEEEPAEEVEVVEEKPAEETDAKEEKPTEKTKEKEESTTKETQEKKAEAVQSTKDSKEISSKATTSSTASPNLELYFESLSEEVNSGKTANFELNVKITGSQTTYTNGEIVVNLPKHPEVPVIYPQIPDGVPNESLKIAGVSPVYDAAAGTLTYNFPELKSGQVYKTIIEAVPELGKTPVSDKENNKRLLEADASIKVDEVPEVIQSEIQSSMVISNGAVNISKAYLQTIKDGEESSDPAVQGDYGIWQVKTSIPKTSAGLTYIKENSEIQVVDKLPRGLIFYANQQEPGFNGVYDSINHTITWKFDAPTFLEQEDAKENLFERELSVKLLFDRSIKNFEIVKNEATINYELHGNVTQQKSATAEIQIGWGTGSVPEITGSYYYPTHYGAKNGLGDRYKNNADGNGNIPTVSDNAYLSFSTQARVSVTSNNNVASPSWEKDWSGRGGPVEDSMRYGYREYAIEYQIDDKLDLQNFLISEPSYRAANSLPTGPLNKLPKTSIQFKVNGQWTSEYKINEYETEINIDQYDINGHIEAFKVSFRDTIGGFSSSVLSHYNIYEGSLGLATNSVKYHIELGNGKKYVVTPRNDQSSLGNRHVLIAENPNLPPPTVQTGIQFVEGGDQPLSASTNIQRGNNRIQVELQSDSSSQSNVDGPLELIALLPKGVNILEQPNILFSDNSESPTYEVIGEVNGQQQIKFIWENRRLLPKEKVSASFDVEVTRTAPSKLMMEVFGFVGNNQIKVPTATGNSLINSVLQTDENDINDNGNTTEQRVRSANKYAITKQDNLQITKEVKGSLDDEFSLFGHTTPDADVTYRFNLTNTTNEVIEQFTFLDVLPSVGDLGITDNKPRESKFEVTLKGPISFVGTKWEDQVTVYYSASKNPKRDDLYETVDFPNGSSPYPNPEGAADPEWKVAGDVNDWDSIHSFMIVMKEGVEWLEGQDIEFEVAAKGPPLPLDRELFDKDIDEVERAAWNSYAVTTNGLLAVEPLRVGVVMELDIVEPEVEKTINDQKETVELLNRDEIFTWKVDYDFGNYTTDWESVKLSDQIHELLDIESVKVVDQDGKDVSGNGVLTTANNLVKFEVNKKDGSFAYLADQTYSLIIESKIKDSATDEQLQPFVEGNGIPNEGVLTIDDDPKKSNEVFVKPPGSGSLEILKIDDTTGAVLEGAEFELRKCEVDENDKENCEVVATGTTNAEGKLLFKDIPLGDYKLVETKAPEGYNILTAPLDVKITKSGQVLEFEVENTKTGWDLPDTGGIGTILFYVVGALLMIGAAIFLLRKRNTSV